MRSSDHALPLLRPDRTSTAGRGGLAFFLVGWSLFLLLNPIYIYEPGEAQPADLLMVVFLFFMIAGYGFRIPVHRDLYMAGYLFLMCVAFVNIIWWFHYGDRRFIMSSIYYTYNFGIAVYVLGLANTYGKSFVTVTRFAIIIALVGELIYAVTLGAGRLRAIGTFSNPNQLGYWSLLSAACYLVLKGNQRLTAPDLGVLAVAVGLGILSGSRGALVGLLVLVAIAIAFQGLSLTNRWSSVLGFFALGLIVLSIMVHFSFDPAAFDRFIDNVVPSASWNRLDPSFDKNATLESRGYSRLWLYPEYMVLGAGEGAYWQRFPRSGMGAEMHSAFGTILFSYGVFGATIFAFLLWRIFRRAPFSHLLYFVPICLYNLTHQGLRFSLFWVFLAAVIAMSRHAPSAAAPEPGRPHRDKVTASGLEATPSRAPGTGR